MKPLWIILIAIAIVGSFFAGKYMGQSAHQNEPQPSESVAATPSASASSNQNSVSPRTISAPSPFAPAQSSAQAQSSAPSQAAAPSSQNFPERDIGESAAVENDSTGELSYAERRKRALEQFPEAQRELDEIALSYKDELLGQMIEVFGTEDSFMVKDPYFNNFLAEDNFLLDEPLAEQSLDEDIAWRDQAKANLEYFFLSKNTDPTMELMSITCLQKRCVVTMTGENAESLQKLTMELRSSKPYGIKKLSPTSTTNVQDSNYWTHLVAYF